MSLFALLLGVNSARAESEEWPLLFSQPVPRSAYLIGKFLALSLIFAAASVLLFLPALTCVFLALGLAAWWLAHPGLWFALLCPAWISTLLLTTARRLERRED